VADNALRIPHLNEKNSTPYQMCSQVLEVTNHYSVIIEGLVSSYILKQWKLQ